MKNSAEIATFPQFLIPARIEIRVSSFKIGSCLVLKCDVEIFLHEPFLSGYSRSARKVASNFAVEVQ